jgi:hypothetical protein
MKYEEFKIDYFDGQNHYQSIYFFFHQWNPVTFFLLFQINDQKIKEMRFWTKNEL